MSLKILTPIKRKRKGRRGKERDKRQKKKLIFMDRESRSVCNNLERNPTK